MTPKVLIAPVGSLEAHCTGLALAGEGVDVTCLPTDDVDAVVLYAEDDAAVSAAELFEDDRKRPLLMVCPRLDGAATERARRAGADALLAWDCSTSTIAAAIVRLLSGHQAPVSADTDPMHALTARERDIVVLLRDGASNEAIALALGISYHTVRTHVAHVLAKLGVTHRYAVASMALGSERIPGLPRAQMAAGGVA